MSSWQNKKMKIVADNKIPFLKGVLEPFAQVIYLPGAKISNRDLRDCDALIIRTRTKCDEKLLENSGVRFIASATIGFDHIDTGYCKSRNIAWTNAPGCNSSSVAQYFASALLSFSMGKNFSLKKKTIGIVGVGNIGSKVAKIAELFGMRILLNDPPLEREWEKGRKRETEEHNPFICLKRIKKEADIITLHVPLNLEGEDKTYNFVDEKFLCELRKSPLLINTSRGEVVDSGALKSAIKTGRISGTVLDVWENEPDIDTELLNLADIATPHIAGYSADGKANGASISVKAVSRFFNLGLDDWYPSNIPEPQSSLSSIDCTGKTEEEILFEAVHTTYDVGADDNRLRNSPETFEKQREEYPLRREFPAYTVKLINDSINIADKLAKLGFKEMV